MSINRERMITTKRWPCKLCENSLSFSLSLLVKRFEEEILLSSDRVLLKTRHLNSFKNSFK